MIIWDDKKNRHVIKVNGSDISMPRENFATPIAIPGLEVAMKSMLDTDLSSYGYHCRMKIESKNPVYYHLWVGRKGIEPHPNWPDYPIEKKIK